MRFSPGETVVRRYFRGDHVTMAQAARVVSDDHLGLLLWVPEGADFACRWHPDGTRLREAPLPAIAAAPLRVTRWVDTDVLILVPPGARHSVWWFFTGGHFTHWYVNLEAPAVRWRDAGTAGLDTVDHVLDIVIEPDGRWEWKDIDEFAASVGPFGYWGTDTAAAIRRAGDEVVAAVAAGRFPFDGTWCSPPVAAGPTPHLPAGDGWWRQGSAARAA